MSIELDYDNSFKRDDYTTLKLYGLRPKQVEEVLSHLSLCQKTALTCLQLSNMDKSVFMPLLRKNEIDALFDHISWCLSEITTLKSLNLRSNEDIITNENVDRVIDFLTYTTHLEELDIACNILNGVGMKKIVRVLEKNKGLKKLSMYDNNSHDIDPVDLRSMLLLPLQSFNLHSFRGNPEHMIYYCDAIMLNTTLTDLNTLINKEWDGKREKMDICASFSYSLKRYNDAYNTRERASKIKTIPGFIINRYTETMTHINLSNMNMIEIPLEMLLFKNITHMRVLNTRIKSNCLTYDSKRVLLFMEKLIYLEIDCDSSKDDNNCFFPTLMYLHANRIRIVNHHKNYIPKDTNGFKNVYMGGLWLKEPTLPNLLFVNCLDAIYLDLSNNQLYQIDPRITLLKSLKIVKLEGNRFYKQAPPVSIEKWIDHEKKFDIKNTEKYKDIEHYMKKCTKNAYLKTEQFPADMNKDVLIRCLYDQGERFIPEIGIVILDSERIDKIKTLPKGIFFRRDILLPCELDMLYDLDLVAFTHDQRYAVFPSCECSEDKQLPIMKNAAFSEVVLCGYLDAYKMICRFHRAFDGDVIVIHLSKTQYVAMFCRRFVLSMKWDAVNTKVVRYCLEGNVTEDDISKFPVDLAYKRERLVESNSNETGMYLMDFIQDPFLFRRKLKTVLEIMEKTQNLWEFYKRPVSDCYHLDVLVDQRNVILDDLIRSLDSMNKNFKKRVETLLFQIRSIKYHHGGLPYSHRVTIINAYNERVVTRKKEIPLFSRVPEDGDIDTDSILLDKDNKRIISFKYKEWDITKPSYMIAPERFMGIPPSVYTNTYTAYMLDLKARNPLEINDISNTSSVSFLSDLLNNRDNIFEKIQCYETYKDTYLSFDPLRRCPENNKEPELIHHQDFSVGFAVNKVILPDKKDYPCSPVLLYGKRSMPMTVFCKDGFPQWTLPDAEEYKEECLDTYVGKNGYIYTSCKGEDGKSSVIKVFSANIGTDIIYTGFLEMTNKKSKRADTYTLYSNGEIRDTKKKFCKRIKEAFETEEQDVFGIFTCDKKKYTFRIYATTESPPVFYMDGKFKQKDQQIVPVMTKEENTSAFTDRVSFLRNMWIHKINNLRQEKSQNIFDFQPICLITYLYENYQFRFIQRDARELLWVSDGSKEIRILDAASPLKKFELQSDNFSVVNGINDMFHVPEMDFMVISADNLVIIISCTSVTTNKVDCLLATKFTEHGCKVVGVHRIPDTNCFLAVSSSGRVNKFQVLMNSNKKLSVVEEMDYIGQIAGPVRISLLVNNFLVVIHCDNKLYCSATAISDSDKEKRVMKETGKVLQHTNLFSLGEKADYFWSSDEQGTFSIWTLTKKETSSGNGDSKHEPTPLSAEK